MFGTCFNVYAMDIFLLFVVSNSPLASAVLVEIVDDGKIVDGVRVNG